MQLVCVTVDSADPARLARFWNETLRWGGVRVTEEGIAICRPADQRFGDTAGSAIYLEFVSVPERKTIKNRLHLGLTAGSLDELDDEIERLTEIGASVAWEEDLPAHVAATYRNVVLRDPEGNEFCLGAGSWPADPS